MRTVYGYEERAWFDMYKLYAHLKEEEPKDLRQVMAFWEGELPRRTPEDCCAVFLQLSAAEDFSTTPVEKLLTKFHDYALLLSLVRGTANQE